MDALIEYIKQAATPVLILVLVFAITVLIRMVKEEWSDKYFDETEFGKKYLVAHGMACGFALIYLCILYFIPENRSCIGALVMLALFYGFTIWVIHIQNSENGGNIENFEGASGAIMYITSALSSDVFILIHALLGGICFWMYKRNDNDVDWKKRIIRRVIDCVEVLVATIIANIFVVHTFIQYLWINSIIIEVFTLIIPFFNDWLYKRFDID